MTRWNEVSLGEVTAHRPICYGVLKPGERDPDGVPLIRVTDINRNHLCVDDLYFISKKLSGEFKRSVLDGGEVLLSIQGTVGRVAICPNELAGANVSRTIAIISPDGRLSNEFLRYWLLWRDGTFPVGGATRASLNIGDIRQLMVPLPPLDEQKRIVAKLDQAFAALDRARADAEANLTDVEGLFSSELTSIFSIDSLPVEQVHAISDVFSTATGNTPSKSQETFYGGDISFVKPPELTGGVVGETSDHLSELGERNARLAPEGTVLVSCIGNLGKVGLLRRRSAFNQQINAILPTEGAVPEFVMYQCRSRQFSEQLQQRASGTTVSIVNKTQFNGLSFWLPAVDAQLFIASRLSELEKQCGILRGLCLAKLADIAALRQSLLQAAFSGQLT